MPPDAARLPHLLSTARSVAHAAARPTGPPPQQPAGPLVGADPGTLQPPSTIERTQLPSPSTPLLSTASSFPARPAFHDSSYRADASPPRICPAASCGPAPSYIRTPRPHVDAASSGYLHILSDLVLAVDPVQPTPPLRPRSRLPGPPSAADIPGPADPELSWQHRSCATSPVPPVPAQWPRGPTPTCSPHGPAYRRDRRETWRSRHSDP